MEAVGGGDPRVYLRSGLRIRVDPSEVFTAKVFDFVFRTDKRHLVCHGAFQIFESAGEMETLTRWDSDN
jgi:hypothetical protein